jgi:hypothetical protein
MAEDREAPCVDEGRHPCTQDALAREVKDNGDRTQIEAKRWSDASESNETWCDIGGRPREEAGLTASRRFGAGLFE